MDSHAGGWFPDRRCRHRKHCARAWWIRPDAQPAERCRRMDMTASGLRPRPLLGVSNTRVPGAYALLKPFAMMLFRLRASTNRSGRCWHLGRYGGYKKTGDAFGALKAYGVRTAVAGYQSCVRGLGTETQLGLDASGTGLADACGELARQVVAKSRICSHHGPRARRSIGRFAVRLVEPGSAASALRVGRFGITSARHAEKRSKATSSGQPQWVLGALGGFPPD